MTIAEIATKHNKRHGTVAQYIARHEGDMIERGVIRQSGSTWLMLAEEASRIWGRGEST